jgi:hypothetical protein
MRVLLREAGEATLQGAGGLQAPAAPNSIKIPLIFSSRTPTEMVLQGNLSSDAHSLLAEPAATNHFRGGGQPDTQGFHFH